MAHRLLARPAEEGLRPGTPLGDTAGLVQSDDGVERRVDDPTQARLRRLELELDRPTGDEPADLVGDRLEHGEEVVIDLPAHLAAPKLDRGKDAVAVADREAEHGVQPGVGRGLGTREPWLDAHVGDPGRRRGRPDAAGKALALAKLPRPARGEPCVETGTVELPGLAHVHHVPRGVDAPEHRRVPAEALAEGPQDLLPYVAVPARTGDDAGDGMDRLEMTLGARALGDVDREPDDAVGLAPRVAQRRVVHVERHAAEVDFRLHRLALEGALDAPHDRGDIRVHLDRRPADGLTRCEAEPFEGATLTEQEAAVPVEDEQHDGRRRHGGAEARLSLVLLGLGAALGGHVHEARHDERGLAVSAHDRHGLAEQPDIRAVGAHDARDLAADRALLAERADGHEVVAGQRRPVLAESRDAAEERLPDDLVARRPEHTQRGVVRVDERASAVAHDDPARDRVVDVTDQPRGVDALPRVRFHPHRDSNAIGARPSHERRGRIESASSAPVATAP